MRDVERIGKITELIKEAWETVPDLRLWQFLLLVLKYLPDEKKGIDPFFFEEDVWTDALKRIIERKETT